jgi:hypothetical protein
MLLIYVLNSHVDAARSAAIIPPDGKIGGWGRTGQAQRMNNRQQLTVLSMQRASRELSRLADPWTIGNLDRPCGACWSHFPQIKSDGNDENGLYHG